MLLELNKKKGPSGPFYLGICFVTLIQACKSSKDWVLFSQIILLFVIILKASELLGLLGKGLDFLGCSINLASGFRLIVSGYTGIVD